MSRYIDADELKENMLYGMCGTGYQTLALSLIEEIPTADVVEVVRCRECKWYDWVDCNNPVVTAFPNSVRDEDNYCNFGERKEQEHE